MTSGLPHELAGLPRELAEGVYWLGTCHPFAGPHGVLHTSNSMFLVSGDDASLLAETGSPQDREIIDHQIDEVMATGMPPVRYVWASHQETPHCGGIPHWLTRFPDAQLCGNVHDYHLLFPEFAHRFLPLNVGDAVHLGGTEFVLTEAVLRDMSTTQWGFDTRRRVLFPSDGFALFHYHDVGHCGRLADEVDAELDVDVAWGAANEIVLYWSRFLDLNPYVERVEQLIETLGVKVIASTHGLPIIDVPRMLPTASEALRRAIDVG